MYTISVYVDEITFNKDINEINIIVKKLENLIRNRSEKYELYVIKRRIVQAFYNLYEKFIGAY